MYTCERNYTGCCRRWQLWAVLGRYHHITLTYPGNHDGFSKGVEMAMVKRDRKKHIIDQVDRLQEYGDEEASVDCTASCGEKGDLTRRGTVVQSGDEKRRRR